MNTNNLELNAGDDFIIALDISASMQAGDCPNGTSRIQYAQEQFRTFVGEASKFDTDGVSLYAFGAHLHQFPDVAADKLDATIDRLRSLPLEGMTLTNLAIAAAFKEHKDRGNEQTVLMIFTDGEPASQTDVFNVIADITKQLKDEHEFAISFITVGQRSPSLEQFLTKLDDAIPGAVFDIVDVKRLEEVDFIAAFTGAVHD